MKRALLTILLLLSSPMAADWVGVPGKPFLPVLMEFYEFQADKPTANDLFDAVNGTREAAGYLRMTDMVPTLLSMWHRESAFNPTAAAGAGEDSKGVAMTREYEVPRWLAFWRAKGVELGPFSTTRTQVFCGVAEFYTKLQQSRGDVHEAVRRYNGSGPAARRYARRVMVSRRVIFGKPYQKGETHPVRRPE